MNRHLLHLSAAALLVAPAIAPAAVLSYEPFSGYTAGLLNAGASPAVAGYTGNWTRIDFGNAGAGVIPGSLTYSNPAYVGSAGDRVGVAFDTTGGEITAANSGRFYRSMDSAISVNSASTGSLYFSFLFQSGHETGATTYQTLALTDNTSTFDGARFDVGINSGNQYTFEYNGTITGTGVATSTATRLFVLKFDLSAAANSDSVTVWIDPVLGGAGDPAGGITSTGKNFSWNRIGISDYEGSSAAWDEFRWGTDFRSVTVPEPSVAMLGGLALFGLARRRRNA